MIIRVGGLVLMMGLTISIACHATPTSPLYQATDWYNNSAEHNAIYREVFLCGEQQVLTQVKSQSLKPHQWGVIFDIDDTLLNNGQYAEQVMMQGKRFGQGGTAWAMQAKDPATPGAVKITCDLQKAGGYVSLITDRDGAYVNPKTGETMLQATIKNLQQQGICFDQVILAKNNADWNKNPRFEAVQSGHYAKGMLYSNILPAHLVLAYFGDNIQDMPHLTQAQMMQQNPNGSAYADFGVSYFVLPNPVYGSWTHNPRSQS